MKSVQANLVNSLIGNSLEAVKYSDIKPNKEYLVVVDGIDQYLDIHSRKSIIERNDLPDHFFDQMSILMTHSEDGELINCSTPGMGRHLYKMSGEKLNETLVNLMVFMQSLVMELNQDIEQLQDMCRMTDDDIINEMDWFAEQARINEVNITAYDLSVL
jgi:hypothetical protein